MARQGLLSTAAEAGSRFHWGSAAISPETASLEAYASSRSKGERSNV